MTTTAKPDDSSAYPWPSRRGMPTIQSAPSTAPVTDVIPPNTTVTTRFSDSVGPNVVPGVLEKLMSRPP